ncbi:UTP-glucose-1-phosphate uridylyltransferase [Listeria phage LIS04]|nr:UTP-glucose-1-phosphate uridylyltransferase [Listeria phage LIS04]
MKVTKAVIPAAGLGTRFLPATKSVPKEMLNMIDRPTIDYIVEEAVNSGITDILIITGRNKYSIENYFDHNYELSHILQSRGKEDLADSLDEMSNKVNIYYTRQSEQLGLGHAILQAKSFVGDDPFAVLLGDDIMMSDTDEPCLSKMIRNYEFHECPVIATTQVPKDKVSSYGIANIEPSLRDSRYQVITELVEKPSVEEAKSNYAVVGRYILTPDIFNLLEVTEAGAGGEIQLTDALNELIYYRTIYSYHFSGRRYDAGNKAEFVKAIIDISIGRSDIGDEILSHISKYLPSRGVL